MKIYYITGPYSARTVFGRIWNIYKAGRVALKYWEKSNCAVICPHLNTALMGELWFHSDKCDYETFMAGDFELLKRCDAIVCIKNWMKSKGAVREWEWAVHLRKEIIYEQ